MRYVKQIFHPEKRRYFKRLRILFNISDNSEQPELVFQVQDAGRNDFGV